ncbi:MAG: polymer-forming cytoskeletal protein [Myxococcales bacterium]|nr:polymer-forming cytoskeletal protein [Myxococcota bacterium]MDW8283612.1 polymer-forming cytoskeletal protein [Myxococcales bacterium]
MANTNTIGPATRINGSVDTDEDLTVEGRIEGGPVRVRGRLNIAARGIVLSEETEVREAFIVGVFVGTLKSTDVVRIHQDGRIVGDVVAPRVVFVSDKPIAERTQTKPAAPPPRPRTEEPSASQEAAPEPAQATSDKEPRSIPPLPGLGHRSMQRKE